MEMISISNHLRMLVDVVNAIREYNANYGGYYSEEDFLEMFDTMKLIEIAGNITETKYSPFSQAGMFCHGVHEHELKKQLTIEPYLFHLSVFSTAWMGLESLINYIRIAESNVGKINSLCYQLNSYSSEIKIPREYKRCLSTWIEIEEKLYGKFKGRNKIPDYIDLSSEGIYRVYSLRNHLVHGNFSSILPSDPLWDDYIEFLALGIRIIAFTIQMLFMGYYSCEKGASTYWHGSLNEYAEYVCIERAFKFLHLEWI